MVGVAGVLLFACAPALLRGGAVSSVAPASARVSRSRIVASPVTEAAAEVASGVSRLAADRYVATNNFQVRPGQEAKFEARWANRKSRLANLNGFRYFQLMRRVKLRDEQPDYEDDFSYRSFTIWEDKAAFDEWRSGDAFKEAHGGTSIGAFLGAMISSLRVLKGPPRPIFYDGLLHLSTKPTELPETEGGWRVLQADGETLLPAEAFVACNEFAVIRGQEEAFEQQWAKRESQLSELPGFVCFSMLRRDFGTKGHGGGGDGNDDVNYSSVTVWKDKASFMKWLESKQFSNAHKGAGSGGSGGEQSSAAPPAPKWSRPPRPAYYEAMLVLTSPDGA